MLSQWGKKRAAIAAAVVAAALVVVSTTKVPAKVEMVFLERRLTLVDEGDGFPPLFPLSFSDYVGFFLAIAGLMLSAGGGIGGGGILVPIYILILNFPVKQAIPLASVTVLGGAIANNALNVRKRHPEHRSLPCIDWVLILLMEPPTMAGALIGANLNVLLPELVVVVLLLLLLTLTAYQTLMQANKLHEKESEAIRLAEKTTDEESLLLDADAPKEQEASYRTMSASEDESNGHAEHLEGEHLEVGRQVSSFPPNDDVDNASCHARRSMIMVVALFVVVTSINLSNGGTENVGGSVGWLSDMLILVLIVSFCWYVRAKLLSHLAAGETVASGIPWDEKNTVYYPLLAVLAGLVAGLFGIGGGIVKGPLMLALGVHPVVASATSACMILFTSATATVSYAAVGLLIYDYAIFCLMIGLGATLAGQTVMSMLLKRYQRNSYIAYCIGIVVGLSAVCMTVESVSAIMGM